MQTLDNGSILFGPKETIVTINGWRPSDDNPRLHVPDFPKCIHLELEAKKLPCNRIVSRYCCKLKNRETTAVSVCKKCTVRAEA